MKGVGFLITIIRIPGKERGSLPWRRQGNRRHEPISRKQSQFWMLCEVFELEGMEKDTCQRNHKWDFCRCLHRSLMSVETCVFSLQFLRYCWHGRRKVYASERRERKETLWVYIIELTASDVRVLWHVGRLLGNDRETSNYTAVIAK
jgi:hypothetical protein